MLFKRKKPLYDYSPQELSLESLYQLHAGLIAKLTLTDEELINRLQSLEGLSKEIENTEDSREVFNRGKKRLYNLHKILVEELAYLTKNPQ